MEIEAHWERLTNIGSYDLKINHVVKVREGLPKKVEINHDFCYKASGVKKAHFRP